MQIQHAKISLIMWLCAGVCFAGGGHLHSKVGGSDLHLSLLLADPEK